MMVQSNLPCATRRHGAFSRGLALGAAGFLAVGLAAHAARAETRGYAVSWFYTAAESQKDDCPDGTNPLSDVMVRQFLVDMGKTPAEIAKLYEDYPNNLYVPLYMRGKRDGQWVNVYANPTSVPDPNIKTVKGHVAYGFNLDGKDGPNDFVDPQTSEHGVDDMLYRAVGCFISSRTRSCWAEPPRSLPCACGPTSASRRSWCSSAWPDRAGGRSSGTCTPRCRTGSGPRRSPCDRVGRYA